MDLYTKCSNNKTVQKGKGKSTILLFITFIMDRRNGQKSKQGNKLSKTVNHIDLTDVYRLVH